MRILRTLPLVIGILLAGGAASPALAQKNTCKDVPIRWFIYPVATLADGTTVAAAVVGDSNWYAASSGTSNTVIHVCGDSATRDATLLMGTKRKLTVSLPEPIPGSVVEETLAGTYQSGAFVNVRNILCFGCSVAPGQPFTTRMAFQLPGLADRKDYRLRFPPLVTDAVSTYTRVDLVEVENTPYVTSTVQVIPQPYDCAAGGTVKPSWIVRGTNASSDPSVPGSHNLQVGTLSRIASNGTRYHAGQYSMPFEIRIEALSCYVY